jgi:hypothetical protein
VVLDAPVEEPHHTLDDRDVGTVAAVPVQRADELFGHQHRVQVATRPLRRQRVIAGIDEVGADLERRNSVARPPERAHQTRCHSGLPAAGRRRGDDDGWCTHATFPAERL